MTDGPQPQVACPACAVDGPVVLAGGREITVGTVAVLLERTPVVACPDLHGAIPDGTVAAAMAATEATIVRARSRLWRGDACATCRAALTMPARRTTRVVSVAADDHAGLPVLTLHLDLPQVRCTECGTEQLPSRSQEDLVVSVPAVFARGTQS